MQVYIYTRVRIFITIQLSALFALRIPVNKPGTHVITLTSRHHRTYIFELRVLKFSECNMICGLVSYVIYKKTYLALPAVYFICSLPIQICASFVSSVSTVQMLLRSFSDI